MKNMLKYNKNICLYIILSGPPSLSEPVTIRTGPDLGTGKSIGYPNPMSIFIFHPFNQLYWREVLGPFFVIFKNFIIFCTRTKENECQTSFNMGELSCIIFQMYEHLILTFK